MLTLLALACAPSPPAAPPPPPVDDLELRVAEGGVWLGERRLVASPFEDPAKEIDALAAALRAEREAHPVERVIARVPDSSVAGALSDLVYVTDQVGLPIVWRREDGSDRPLTLVDFSRLAPTGWLVGQRSVLVTTVVVDREGRREGNVALVSAPATVGRLDDPSTRPPGAIDPREPLDCAAMFADPDRQQACLHPPEVVPNGFAEGCFLPARDAATGADWDARLGGLASKVDGDLDERWLLVPKDLPLAEVGPLLAALDPLGEGPIAFLGGRVRQDCARSVPFPDGARPDLLGAVMVGKGHHHQMASQPPPPELSVPTPRDDEAGPRGPAPR